MSHELSNTFPPLMGGHPIDLSVVVPFYNCSNSVSAILEMLGSGLRRLGYNHEIIAVNDGSSDNTMEYLTKAAEMNPHVLICSYERNMGKGYAIRHGIGLSRGRIVTFIDGDLDISPDLLLHYVKALEDCDLVIASKRHPLSKVKMLTSRKILSKSFNFLAKSLTGLRVSDTQVGLKAGRGSLLRAIFSVMTVNRYAFDVEFLTIATLLGVRIREMPIELRIEKKFKPMQVLQMFNDTLSVAYRLRFRREFQLLKMEIEERVNTEVSLLRKDQIRELQYDSSESLRSEIRATN